MHFNGRRKHGYGVFVEVAWPQSNQKFSIQQTVQRLVSHFSGPFKQVV